MKGGKDGIVTSGRTLEEMDKRVLIGKICMELRHISFLNFNNN